MIDYVSKRVESISRDDSLASLLEIVVKKQLRSSPSPPNYYYLTDLTNPIQKFYSNNNPTVRKSQELSRKLIQGTQLHQLSGCWFRNLEGFVLEEGTLDGIWMGVDGVRGKIDYRIGESLVEFKTKDKIPKNSGEVIQYFPQDLEQLAFYSVIHPLKPKVNYLVFMTNSKPYDLISFRLDIIDYGTLKSVMISRIKQLNDALENNNPTNLGKCRYYDENCQYRAEDICSCKDIEPLNNESLIRSIELNYEEDFTNKLIEAKNKFEDTYNVSLSTLNIIAPRKRHMGLNRGIESSYKKTDLEEEYYACLWHSINTLKNDNGINLTKNERGIIIKSQIENRMNIGYRWIKVKSSAKEEPEILPYIYKVSLSENPKSSRFLSDYQLCELGIICAVYGKTKGIIFRVFANQENLIQVFQITYKNIEQIRKKVSSVIDLINDVDKSDDILQLHPCPPFMNDGKKCQLYKECHSREGCGCTPKI